MMWTDGLIRIWPAWEFYLRRHTIPAAVWVAVVMGLVFVLLIVYPFLEKQFSGDDAHHNLLQRPRDAPVRTAIGAMAIAFYIVLTLACDERHHRAEVPHLAERDDVDRPHRHGGAAARSSTSSPTGGASALQRSDRAVLEHGIETGIIKRLPHGAYVELHQPLGPVDDHGHPIPLEYQGAALPKRMNKLGSGGAPGTRQLPVRRSGRPSTRRSREAAHAAEHRALTALREHQERTSSPQRHRRTARTVERSRPTDTSSTDGHRTEPSQPRGGGAAQSLCVGWRRRQLASASTSGQLAQEVPRAMPTHATVTTPATP